MLGSLGKIENDGRGGERTAAAERGVERSTLDPAILGRHGIFDVDRLLVRNRFAVAPSRVPMAIIVTLVSLMNSLFWLVQSALYGRKIAATEVQEDPIFVIGHWRSGTTLLHELLILDPRHTYPDTFACFAPSHFLVSGWLFRPLLRAVAAGEAADGQHGRRLGPAARG